MTEDRGADYGPPPSDHHHHHHHRPRPRIADTLSALRMVRDAYRKPTIEPEGNPHDDA